MRRLSPLLAAMALAASAHAAQPDARAELARMEREIESLRGELVSLARIERTSRVQATAQRERLAELSAQEAEIRVHLDSRRGEIARLLGALQMHSRHPPPPLLVNPRSARDAVRAAILIQAVQPELQARARELGDQAATVSRLRRQAAAASETLFTAESGLADRGARMERLLADKRALEIQLFGTADEARSRALGARVGSMGELVEELAGRPARAASPPTSLTVPVEGSVRRRFGDPEPGRGRSQGWSWRAEHGSLVVSPAAGQVDYSGPLRGWGEVVILSVGGGYRVVLAGLGRVDVGAGRDVAAGEPVGRLPEATAENGQTVAASELYLEFRSRARPVDPANLLASATRR